jgi:hypothetical protein
MTVDAGCFPIPSGVISLWSANGDALDRVGTNHGTLSGGTTYTAGRFGQAFLFNGLAATVSAPSTGIPSGSADRTIELWVRIDAVSMNNQPFFAGYGSFGVPGATYQVGTFGGGGFSYFSTWGQVLQGRSIPTMAWTHVAVTTQGQLTILYLDGNIAAAGAINVSTPASSTFYIGRIGDGSSWGNSERVTGAIDEVTVYDRALSASEIGAIASNPLGKCAP